MLWGDGIWPTVQDKTFKQAKIVRQNIAGLLKATDWDPDLSSILKMPKRRTSF
jgi:hypothetical protein